MPFLFLFVYKPQGSSGDPLGNLLLSVLCGRYFGAGAAGLTLIALLIRQLAGLLPIPLGSPPDIPLTCSLCLWSCRAGHNCIVVASLVPTSQHSELTSYHPLPTASPSIGAVSISCLL